MNRLRTALAWTLFWAGHVVSLPIGWWNWAWLYPAYNWLMVTSVRFDTDNRVWERIDQ